MLRDEDLQLALYCSYELHYRGLPDVDDAWEWEPSLLALRRSLEERFEDARRLADRGGAQRQRAAMAQWGVRAVAAELADRFLGE